MKGKGVPPGVLVWTIGRTLSGIFEGKGSVLRLVAVGITLYLGAPSLTTIYYHQLLKLNYIMLKKKKRC